MRIWSHHVQSVLKHTVMKLVLNILLTIHIPGNVSEKFTLLEKAGTSNAPCGQLLLFSLSSASLTQTRSVALQEGGHSLETSQHIPSGDTSVKERS